MPMQVFYSDDLRHMLKPPATLTPAHHFVTDLAGSDIDAAWRAMNQLDEVDAWILTQIDGHTHASMSVGDAVVANGRVWIADHLGWIDGGQCVPL